VLKGVPVSLDAIVIVKVVEVGTDVTINLTSSKVAFVNVEPLNPLTLSNKTISSSVKPWSEPTVTVTVGLLDVLVKLAPVIVVLIGCMS